MAWKKIATSVKDLGEHLAALSEDVLFAGTMISKEDRNKISQNLATIQSLVKETDSIVESYLEGKPSDR